LQSKLATEWPSGAILSAEAGIVFGAHGMNKENIMQNLALFNVLWDGGSNPTDRRTSESFNLRGARLTLSLQVQAPTLLSFIEKSRELARGTGFLARFLISWPDSTQGCRSYTEPPHSWPALEAFSRRILELLDHPVPIGHHGALSPDILKLAPDAKKAWIIFHDAIEAELADGGELRDVRDVASKSADNVVRLAALFQIFVHGFGGPVVVDAIENASRIVAWHLNESRRFLGELALPTDLANAARLDAWLIKYCRQKQTNTVPTKTVQQYGPGRLREKAAIEAAVIELHELNRIRLDNEGRRKIISVNPALLNCTK
jgi:putative DNA primase/helicase